MNPPPLVGSDVEREAGDDEAQRMEVSVTLAVLVGATILFAMDRIRPDLVAILAMLTLALTGVLTPEESFSGFASPAVAVLISAFVISAALSRVGVSRMIGRLITKIGGTNEERLVGFTTAAAATLSLVMNNVAAAAVLLPGVMDVSRRSSTPPSRILIPLAYATQLGGMATLLTTSNLVASAALRDQGLEGFGLLDFLPVGGPIALAGLAYLLVFGRKVLPRRTLTETVVSREQRPLLEIYGLHAGLFSLRILQGSPFAGSTIHDANLRARLGLTVVALQHPRRALQTAPPPSTQLRTQDVLTVHGPPPSEESLKELGLERLDTGLPPSVPWESLGLVEVVLSPRSKLADATLREVGFRERYHLTVVALWRNGQPVTEGLADFELRFGDALLVQGERKDVELLHGDPDFIVLTQEHRPPIRQQKVGLAVAIIAASLALGISGFVPISIALLTGAAALVLTKCLTMEEGYRGIDWRAVVMIGAMLPIGLALTRSGAADLIGGWLASTVAPFGEWALLAAMVLFTVALAQMIPGGAAVPLVIVPLAVAAASRVGADPRAFAMAVALASSATMSSPFAHSVNVMIMGVGGYTFRDYVRAELPLVVLVTTLILVLVPMVM